MLFTVIVIGKWYKILGGDEVTAAEVLNIRKEQQVRPESTRRILTTEIADAKNGAASKNNTWCVMQYPGNVKKLSRGVVSGSLLPEGVVILPLYEAAVTAYPQEAQDEIAILLAN